MKETPVAKRKWLLVHELTVFSMLGTVMYISKIFMEWAPNIHFLGMLTISYTLVYRKKALIPIYIYVFLNGLFSGFSMWWFPYLYIWAVLWGATMLLPKNMSETLSAVVCSILCGLHGFLFGILYAPAQAIMMNLSFESTVAWVLSGLVFDITHGIGNLAAGMLIVPTTILLCKIEHKPYVFRKRKG